MEEFPNKRESKWKKIWKKKWFFPAIYLIVATFLLTGVIWYQQAQSNLIESLDDTEQGDEYATNRFDEEVESVLQQQEVIKMPVQEDVQTEIVTKFYEYEADQDEQEKGLTLYNNRYYQSTGVNIAASDGEPFDVVASLSGTVEEVKEDPLLGHVVVLSHEDEISTYYASLAEVHVKEGEEVKQGDMVGVAGKNLFNEESGTHVHFEIRKDDIEVNPEQFFNEPITALIDYDVEILKENMDESDSTPATEEDEPEDEEDSEDKESDETDENNATNRDISLFMLA